MITEHGLPVASSTYHEHVKPQPCPRERRDAALIDEIRQVHAVNYGVYGARKALRRSDRDGSSDCPGVAPGPASVSPAERFRVP